MARPTLFTNRKLLKLAQRLQSKALAVGSLELIWHAANETGNPIIGDSDDVEAVADWRGSRGELVAALLECGSNGGPGFIFRRDDGRFEIHDYWHHAPDYVRKRAKREHDRRLSGNELHQNDRPVTGQNGVLTGHADLSKNSENGADRSKRSATLHSDQSLTGQNAVGNPKNDVFFRTPAPAPTLKSPLTPLPGGNRSLSRPGAGRKSRDIRSLSSTAWGAVVTAVARSTERQSLEASDALIADAVQSIGGWHRLGSLPIGRLKDFKAQFRERYEQALQTQREDAA